MATYLKEARERPKEDLTAVREAVSEILSRVREEGEAAVRFYSEKFDKWSPKSFKLSEDEIASAKKQLSETMISDIDFCQEQIRKFATSR